MKIAEAEAAVSVKEKKWLVMDMHVQLKLDELWAPQTLGSLHAALCLGREPSSAEPPHWPAQVRLPLY